MTTSPSAFTGPFWSALAEGSLLVPECQACHRRFFTPEPLCVRCGAAGWIWVTSPGDGEVYSVSVVSQAVNDDHPVPFALTVVDLDDGWSMLTHVVGIAPQDVRIGMRVRFAPMPGRYGPLPTFTPV